jgi:Cu/Zn superoxide dismutase
MSRTRSAILAAALAVALATPVAVAAAATKTLHATLSGQAEVPKAGDGTGTARITLDDAKKQICFRITLKGVGTTMAGHIHKGGKTVAGPIVVPLFTKPTTKPKGCVTAKSSVIKDIREHPSRYYVNVHTEQYPAGAARGELH